MKKTYLILTALILLAGLTSLTPANLKVRFSQSEWEAAQNQAISEKKLYYVDFDASYCAACRNMEQGTYMDMNLARYMESHVVALRIDVQDFDGVMWSQQYEVEALPTMLIFDEKGKLVKRLTGYKSSADLIRAFQEARNPSLAAMAGSTTAPAPTPVAMPNTPAAIPAPRQPNAPKQPVASSPSPMPAQEDQPYRPAAKPNPSPAPVAAAPVAAPVASMPIYEVGVKRAPKEGFSLQVGAFASYEATMEQCEKLQNNFPNQKMYLQTDKNPDNNQLVYRLLLGNFESRSAANSFRSELKKKGMDGLIRDLQFI